MGDRKQSSLAAESEDTRPEEGDTQVPAAASHTLRGTLLQAEKCRLPVCISLLLWPLKISFSRDASVSSVAWGETAGVRPPLPSQK